MKITVYSVTPSPYQRDFFNALQRIDDCEVEVVYFETAPGDSPWHHPELADWESILSGFSVGTGRVRSHINRLPSIPADTDVVIVNAQITGVTTQRLFRQLTRAKIPWYFWGELLLARTGLKRQIQQLLLDPLRHAQGIVAIGEKARLDYQQRFPESPVFNIPYTCALQAFQPASPKPRSAGTPFRFLYVGQMIERKGVDVLLTAFEKLYQSGVSAELHLVGTPGELQTWLTQLTAHTRQAIIYHGFQQPDALAGYFRQADVFVIASRHDGWGVVVNQAFGAGLPVIATTAVGAAEELVESGFNGYLVPPADAAALSDVMREVLGDPVKLEQLSANALTTARRLEPGEAAQQWLTIIRGSAAPAGG